MHKFLMPQARALQDKAISEMYSKGKSYKKIGLKLNLSSTTVRQKIRRAKREEDLKLPEDATFLREIIASSRLKNALKRMGAQDMTFQDFAAHTSIIDLFDLPNVSYKTTCEMVFIMTEKGLTDKEIKQWIDRRRK